MATVSSSRRNSVASFDSFPITGSRTEERPIALYQVVLAACQLEFDHLPADILVDSTITSLWEGFCKTNAPEYLSYLLDKFCASHVDDLPNRLLEDIVLALNEHLLSQLRQRSFSFGAALVVCVLADALLIGVARRYQFECLPLVATPSSATVRALDIIAQQETVVDVDTMECTLWAATAMLLACRYTAQYEDFATAVLTRALSAVENVTLAVPGKLAVATWRLVASAAQVGLAVDLRELALKKCVSFLPLVDWTCSSTRLLFQAMAMLLHRRRRRDCEIAEPEFTNLREQALEVVLHALGFASSLAPRVMHWVFMAANSVFSGVKLQSKYDFIKRFAQLILDAMLPELRAELDDATKLSIAERQAAALQLLKTLCASDSEAVALLCNEFSLRLHLQAVFMWFRNCSREYFAIDSRFEIAVEIALTLSTANLKILIDWMHDSSPLDSHADVFRFLGVRSDASEFEHRSYDEAVIAALEQQSAPVLRALQHVASFMGHTDEDVLMQHWVSDLIADLSGSIPLVVTASSGKVVSVDFNSASSGSTVSCTELTLGPCSKPYKTRSMPTELSRNLLQLGANKPWFHGTSIAAAESIVQTPGMFVYTNSASHDFAGPDLTSWASTYVVNDFWKAVTCGKRAASSRDTHVAVLVFEDVETTIGQQRKGLSLQYNQLWQDYVKASRSAKRPMAAAIAQVLQGLGAAAGISTASDIEWVSGPVCSSGFDTQNPQPVGTLVQFAVKQSAALDLVKTFKGIVYVKI